MNKTVEFNYEASKISIELNRQAESIVSICLSNNKITTLDPFIFDQFVSLEHIDFSLNNISYLSPDIFNRLKCIQSINFSNNLIKKLDCGLFTGLDKLERIDFKMNELKQLESKIFSNLTNLKSIDFSMNFLSLNKRLLLNELFKYEIIIQNNQRGKRKIILESIQNCANLVIATFDGEVDFIKLRKSANENTALDYLIQNKNITTTFLQELIENLKLTIKNKQITKENNLSVQIRNTETFKNLLNRGYDSLFEYFLYGNVSLIEHDFKAYSYISLDSNSESLALSISNFVHTHNNLRSKFEAITDRDKLFAEIIHDKQWWRFLSKILDSCQLQENLYNFTFLEYKAINKDSIQTAAHKNVIYNKVKQTDEISANLEIMNNKSKLHPLMLIAMSGQPILIKHPTVLKLLDLKFKFIPRIILILNMLIYGLFAIFYSLNSERMIDNAMQNRVTSLREDFGSFYFTASFFLLVVIILGEMIKIFELKLKYFLSTKNIIQLVTFILCFFALIIQEKIAKSSLYSLSILHVYIVLLNEFEQMPSIGKYAVAYRKTIGQILKLAPVIIVMIFGFMFSFRIRSLFEGSATYLNKSHSFSIIKLLTMLIGDFQTDQMGLDEGLSIKNMVDYLLYYKFVVLMSILLINLTVGLCIGEINTVMDESELKNLKTRIKFVLKVQDCLVDMSRLFNKIFLRKEPKTYWFESIMTFKQHDFSKEYKLLGFIKKIWKKLKGSKLRIVHDNEINFNKQLHTNINNILHKIDHIDLINNNIMNEFQFESSDETNA